MAFVTSICDHPEPHLRASTARLHLRPTRRITSSMGPRNRTTTRLTCETQFPPHRRLREQRSHLLGNCTHRAEEQPEGHPHPCAAMAHYRRKDPYAGVAHKGLRPKSGCQARRKPPQEGTLHQIIPGHGGCWRLPVESAPEPDGEGLGTSHYGSFGFHSC